MKSRNSTGNSSRALIALAIFSISGSLLAQGSSDWKAPPTAANRPNPLAGNANATALGQKLYTANCMTCHGPSGKGDGPGGAALEKKPADLGARIRSGETDGTLFWKITEGRSPMVSWRGSLSETQRWELVNYIKTFAGKYMIRAIPIIVDQTIAVAFVALICLFAPSAAMAQDVAPSPSSSDYVSRAEYDKLKVEHEAMKQELDALKATVQQMTAARAPAEAPASEKGVSEE
jgi:mono/diheme cytochrome c family protein